MTISLLIEAVGWTGALMLLLAYGLLTAGRIAGTSVGYQLLNVAGSVALVVNSGWNGALPSASLNLVWMAIGVAALCKAFFAKA